MRKFRALHVPLYALVGVACVAFSCSSKNNGSTVTQSGGSTSSAGANSAGSSGTGVGAGPSVGGSSGGPNLGNLTGGAGGEAGATGGTGALSGDQCGTMCPSGVSSCSPETCDGIDNNCDGVRDNVDKNSDGVCDCLLIATLGFPGKWGTGDVFSAWLSARSNNGATSLGDQVLTPELLAGYQVIVAQDVDSTPHGASGADPNYSTHVYSDAEVQALHDWVTKGGGFMTLIGYADTSEVVNVNRLLAPFGMNYGNMAILPKQGGSTVPITTWNAHPVDNGVMAVGVDTGVETLGMGTVIATNGNYQLGLAQEVMTGHVLMWGDEWITYDSEWTQHPDYQVELFWVNAIKWLTAVNTCQVPVPPGLIK